MTEQEAKKFEAKLARIWKVVSPFRMRAIYGGNFDFTAPVSQDVELRVSIAPIDTRLLVVCELQEIGGDMSFLYCNNFEVAPTLFNILCLTPPLMTIPENIQRRTMEWRPFFRRGCWLCGCAIDLTADEQTEWVQGFDREELESWNLKMRTKKPSILSNIMANLTDSSTSD